MDDILEELKRIIFVSILLIVVFICVTSCASIKQVPVPVKINTTIITCPDIPMATESSVLYDIVDLHKNYEICKHQVQVLKDLLQGE